MEYFELVDEAMVEVFKRNSPIGNTSLVALFSAYQDYLDAVDKWRESHEVLPSM